MVLIALPMALADTYYQQGMNGSSNDAYAREQNPDTSFPTAALELYDSTGQDKHAYIMVDLNNTDITCTTLDELIISVNTVSGDTETDTVSMMEINTTAAGCTWDEATITWNNRPDQFARCMNGTPTDSKDLPVGVGLWYNFNATTIAKTALCRGADNLTVMFNKTIDNGGSSHQFHQKESASPLLAAMFNWSFTSDITPPGLLNNDAWCTSCDPVQKIDNQPWITEDPTPGLNATLNKSGTCAVVLNKTFVGNYNYTDIITNYGGIECSTTGGINQICTVQESNSMTGNGYVCVGCKDGGGNELLNATFCANIDIDSTPPGINITSPINDSTITVDYVDLNWTVNETPDWCAYSLDGGANITVIINTIENIILQTADTENLDDTWTERIDNPSNNHGSDTSLNLDATRDWRIYIKFDISGISPNAILEAYLYLNGGHTNGPTPDVHIYHVTKHDWAEDVIVHSTQPCGANFDSSANCNLTSSDSFTPPTAYVWNACYCSCISCVSSIIS